MNDQSKERGMRVGRNTEAEGLLRWIELKAEAQRAQKPTHERAGQVHAVAAAHTPPAGAGYAALGKKADQRARRERMRAARGNVGSTAPKAVTDRSDEPRFWPTMPEFIRGNGVVIIDDEHGGDYSYLTFVDAARWDSEVGVWRYTLAGYTSDRWTISNLRAAVPSDYPWPLCWWLAFWAWVEG